MADAVATAFASALTRTRGGLSFAALRDGQVIYDVHGGWADREHTRAWGTGTRPTIFSGSRGLVAMCLAILVDRGALGLDAPGPLLLGGFATAGKPRVTVGELASHRAGLPAVQRREGVDLLCSPRRAASLLAAQAPRPELGRRALLSRGHVRVAVRRARRTVTGVAFSFAINELQNEADDRRCRDVLAALHSELAEAGQCRES